MDGKDPRNQFSVCLALAKLGKRFSDVLTEGWRASQRVLLLTLNLVGSSTNRVVNRNWVIEASRKRLQGQLDLFLAFNNIKNLETKSTIQTSKTIVKPAELRSQRPDRRTMTLEIKFSG